MDTQDTEISLDLDIMFHNARHKCCNRHTVYGQCTIPIRTTLETFDKDITKLGYILDHINDKEYHEFKRSILHEPGMEMIPWYNNKITPCIPLDSTIVNVTHWESKSENTCKSVHVIVIQSAFFVIRSCEISGYTMVRRTNTTLTFEQR